jgi:S1-C subfamily serine protease
VPRANADRAAVERALTRAHDVAQRIKRDGDALLTPEDRDVLDLFILVVQRPALFIRKGRVVNPPENWVELGRGSEAMGDVIASVGRLQTSSGATVGTGFLAGPRRVLTNNHVVCGLLGEQDDFWRTDRKSYRDACAGATWSGGSPVFEIFGEAESSASATARVVSVQPHGEVDLAVLELDAMPDTSRTIALSASAPQPVLGRRVFAVGYPTADARDMFGRSITPEPVMARIFGIDAATLGTKRLSPGVLVEGEGEFEISHDASTLRGSSGSCIVDIRTKRVLAIHCGGRYETRNRAIPLWKLAGDPLLGTNILVR